MDPIKLPERPTAYSFNPQTGEYAGTAKVEYDVRHLQAADEIVYLLPAFMTYTAPPETSEKQMPVMKDGSWTLVPDHRGEIWYQGVQPVRIEGLGDPSSQPGLTKEPVLPPQDPQQALRDRKSALFAELQEVSMQIGAFSMDNTQAPEHLRARRLAIAEELKAIDTELKS